MLRVCSASPLHSLGEALWSVVPTVEILCLFYASLFCCVTANSQRNSK